MASNSTNYSCHRKRPIKTFSKKIFMQPRVERMVHSMLTSRVLLQIRAQAGDNAAWSDGLTGLNTTHLS
jgi:hypothetical protein